MFSGKSKNLRYLIYLQLQLNLHILLTILHNPVLILNFVLFEMITQSKAPFTRAIGIASQQAIRGREQSTHT